MNVGELLARGVPEDLYVVSLWPCRNGFYAVDDDGYTWRLTEKGWQVSMNVFAYQAGRLHTRRLS